MKERKYVRKYVYAHVSLSASSREMQPKRAVPAESNTLTLSRLAPLKRRQSEKYPEAPDRLNGQRWRGLNKFDGYLRLVRYPPRELVLSLLG